MIKKQFFLILNIVLSIFVSFVIIRADEITISDNQPHQTIKSVISGYVEIGKRSTSDDYEVEGNDDAYTYNNYHYKLKQYISERFIYDISSFTYRKDYELKNELDNNSNVFKMDLLYYLEKQKEKSLRFDIKLQYKNKNYDNTPAKEYNQFMFMPSFKITKRNLYAINLSGGINNYDYVSAGQKNQLKYIGKFDWYRYFMEKKLMLTGYDAIEHLDHKQTDRDRTKHNLMFGIDYLFESSFVYKIETTIKWGRRDTKEDDDRDEDSDYEYREYNVKTIHEINNKFKTDLKYEYFKKDYNVIALDHNGFYVENGYAYEILNNKIQKSWLNFNIGQKESEYSDKTENNYKKLNANIKFNYDRKKNWKTSFGVESNFYKYNNSDNNKKRYYTKLSVEKLLLNGNLNIFLDLKYRFTDYTQGNNDEQKALKFGANYEF